VRCNDRVFFRDDSHKWQSDQNAARRYVTRAVSGLRIFNPRYQEDPDFAPTWCDMEKESMEIWCDMEKESMEIWCDMEKESMEV
jgi:hypothetical protein